MADLDAKTAAALCRSLTRHLTAELGCALTCVDVSGRSERWDVEVRDQSGALVRCVSHVTTTPQRMAMAGAELRDVRLSAEAALALGVTGVEFSLSARDLPKTRAKRRALGRLLAERVQTHRLTGKPLLENPIQVLLSGRHPHDDPLAAAFADIFIQPTRPDLPARLYAGGDDRLIYRIPELFEEVLPAVAEKRRRHGALASELTLVVEAVLAQADEAAACEVAAHLTDEHRGFAFLYVGAPAGEQFPLWRVH